MRKIIVCAAAALALVAGVMSADAKGCIKGALVGGAAGHFAGHHVGWVRRARPFPLPSLFRSSARRNPPSSPADGGLRGPPAYGEIVAVFEAGR